MISVKPCAPGLKIVVVARPIARTSTTARNTSSDDRHDQDVEHDELHLGGLDLLAQVLRRSPDHEAGDEHREDHEDQHPVEPDTDAARAHLAELHVHERRPAAERREAVVHRVDRAVGGAGRGRRPRSRSAVGPNRTSLPSMLPPGDVGASPSVGTRVVEPRVAVDLEEDATRLASQMTIMTANTALPCRLSFTMCPNVNASANGMRRMRRARGSR